jgi:hypothetical protein
VFSVLISHPTLYVGGRSIVVEKPDYTRRVFEENLGLNAGKRSLAEAVTGRRIGDEPQRGEKGWNVRFRAVTD